MLKLSDRMPSSSSDKPISVLARITTKSSIWPNQCVGRSRVMEPAGCLAAALGNGADGSAKGEYETPTVHSQAQVMK
jgi:hypothetical protein